MIIPKKLKIGGITYDVVVCELEDAGQYKSLECKIYLNEDGKKEMQELTLIHEILHAINNELDEREVEFLAQGIYQVFSDNKLLR